MFNRKSLFALCVIGFLFIQSLATEEKHFISDNVLKITGSNFDEIKGASSYLFVVYFAPWCGHCKRLEPDFKAACDDLANMNPVVKCGSIDATEENALVQNAKISGFPTMKLYVNGNSHDFQGPHSKAGILEWIARVTGPAVHFYESKEEAAKALGTHLLYFAGVFNSKETPEFLAYSEVATMNHGASFQFCAIIASGEQTIYVQHKDDEAISFSGEMKVDLINEFVSKENVPFFGPLNGENYSLYVHRPGLVVWFAGTKEMYEQHFKLIKDVAKKFRSNYSFVWLDSAEFGPYAEQALFVSQFPALVIQKADGSGGRYKYAANDFTNGQAIENFITDVENGKIEKTIKSEPIPEKNDEAVKVVVGNSFEDMVFNNDKDVLLEIYSPWCGHCKSLEPIYKEFAEKMKDNPNLIVAKMDGDANESPVNDFEWRGYPTIFFVKAGEKKPIKFSGARTVESFTEFVESNGSKGGAQRDEL